MTKTYTLSQLVESANALLEKEGLAASVNERLVRHYTSEKKVLSPPEKEGREARYSQAHLDKLVALRRAQKLGITSDAFDNALKYSGTQLESTAMYSSNASAVAGATNSGLANKVFVASAAPFLSGSAHAVGNASAPNQASALSFLRGLEPAKQNEALLGHVGNMMQQATSPNLAPMAEQWVNWDVMPGVRLQMRHENYVAFSADDERALIDVIRNIRKNKP